MDGEDFVVALMMMADEHQANADEYGMLVAGSSDFGIFGELNKGWRKSAAEQQGLADIYKAFAHVITNQMAVERLVEQREAQARWLEQFFSSAEAAVAYMDFYLGRQ